MEDARLKDYPVTESQPCDYSNVDSKNIDLKEAETLSGGCQRLRTIKRKVDSWSLGSRLDGREFECVVV